MIVVMILTMNKIVEYHVVATMTTMTTTTTGVVKDVSMIVLGQRVESWRRSSP